MGRYSEEINVQILIAVLKANNIRKVIVSPGTTNISFVNSLVNDGGFEMYSAIDERGAAYIACGLSSESGEPVVITCTGATASRNYFPGLTEAYHRKLPILAVTASQDFNRNGNLSPQFIDRTIQPVDSVRLSVQIPIVRNNSDEYFATININKAVLELFRHGGGPVHVNLASSYSNGFTVDDLSNVRIIKRYFIEDEFPEMPKEKRIAIIVGNHKPWNKSLTDTVDRFCEIYDSIVLIDHSSNYWGKYRVLPTILSTQEKYTSKLFDIDLLIHIGQEHGDYYTDGPLHQAKEVWRISKDGNICDTYGKLTKVFEMSEELFFNRYASIAINIDNPKHDYLDSFKDEINDLYNRIPELPFSNIWIAKNIIPQFPENAALELGLSNTMRSWTFFDFRKATYVLANTGCRGIDGAIPTLLGMSLVDKTRLHFAVMGDLTFFYSFNVLANRHIGKNIRILVVNNGCGAEFNIYSNRAYQILDGNHDKINEYIAAGGHNGKMSSALLRHYAEDLGFDYLRINNKDEFKDNIEFFLDPNQKQKPVLMEAFVGIEEENEALKIIRNLKTDKSVKMKNTIKKMIGKI